MLNLNPALRQSDKTLILFGLWSGKSKPKWEQLLSVTLASFPLEGLAQTANGAQKFTVSLGFLYL
jgi:hypothetical protein